MEKIGVSYFFGLLIFITLLLCAIYWLYVGTSPEKIPEVKIIDWIGKRRFTLKENGEIERFDLLDPDAAPPEISEKVKFGYRLFNETATYAPSYTDDTLTCNNCHLYGGNTFGGKDGGISLVGVTAVYPKYSKKDGKTIDLKDRINCCFERSMNSNSLSKDSLEMEALVEYLEWISIEVVKEHKIMPWLGLPALESAHIPNPQNGQIIYLKNCSLCHGKEGEGSQGVPPLWGAKSFNDGAGMHKIGTLSSFVWYNMPYQQPTLTQKQALDVAAYVIQQPRPHYQPIETN